MDVNVTRAKWARAMFCAASLAAALCSPAAHAFGFLDVDRSAKELAQKSYEAPKPNLPEALSSLKFAGYQEIRYRADRLHWRDTGTRFQLGFYHQGMHFNAPVRINEVDSAGVKEIKFSPDDFDYGNLKLDKAALNNLGFAGFKVLYPVNKDDKPDDELATFLGASYFRVIGKGQIYGLSARGLALNTALPSGEEFPAFREFWIERPKAEDRHLVIYALLDSPRATGAYRFTIRVGEDTVVDVKSRIYMRDKVDRLGLAPLTSMYLYGSNRQWNAPNYRPELHDSDGLAMHTGSGEWIWRPLNNPRRLAVSAFSMENPRGFGLLQRGREFSRYEDLDDRYELRPSLWIVPESDWGKGSVQLVEIPTGDETNDNIVAFWVPETQPERAVPVDVNYKMIWTLDNKRTHTTDLAWVAQTRRSREEDKGPDLVRRADGTVTYIIDFVGPNLAALPADRAVRAQVWADDNGEVTEASVRSNDVTGGKRLTIKVKAKDAEKPVEMRASLLDGDTTLTETWSYRVLVNAQPEK